MLITEPNTGFEWQSPVITEKHALQCAKNTTSLNIDYLAVPWASIIDRLRTNSEEYKLQAIRAINNLKDLPRKGYTTVCQHYQFRSVLNHMKDIGITTLYTPHATQHDKGNDIDIRPFPLYATITPPVLKRKALWYSFIGAYMDHYMSDIRLNIFNDTHPKNCVVVRRDKWQYNDDVYTSQVWNQDIPEMQRYLNLEKQKYYEYILSNSRFSLCPSGAGPNSIRLFESLSCGSIPVILSDALQLPQVKTVDWSECVITVPEDEYHNLRLILKDIPLSRERDMSMNCVEAYKHVSDENFIECIIDAV